MKNNIHVALIGYGTVGEVVARLLLQEGNILAEKSGIHLLLRYIVDRDPSSIDVNAPEVRCLSGYQPALDDPQVSIVVELIGGTTEAYTICTKALKAGKHVVTANKALLAEYGPELLALAHTNNVSVAYEASCGGGIPILRALYSGLIGNRIDAIFAIINGTCNYILTKMSKDGSSYREALHQAQELGYAERDPTLDVDGTDSAHKLALITSLAFGVNLTWGNINTSGIQNIHSQDIEYGKMLGYQPKLVATSIRTNQGIVAGVEVMFLPLDHPLRWVEGSFNAVSVYGHATGHTLFYGKGAGGEPTASAVIADIMGIATEEIPQAFKHFSHWPDRCHNQHPLSARTLRRRYYLRIMAPDSPGTLARVCSILASHSLSIAAIHQPEVVAPETAMVPVIVTLQPAQGEDVYQAVAEIAPLSDECIVIPILEEHTESL